MMSEKGIVFSSGTEYECFLYEYCERCKHYKLSPNGYPEFPENGGCKILDAMENARWDNSLFPCEQIRKDKNEKGYSYQFCVDFCSRREKREFGTDKDK